MTKKTVYMYIHPETFGKPLQHITLLKLERTSTEHIQASIKDLRREIEIQKRLTEIGASDGELRPYMDRLVVAEGIYEWIDADVDYYKLEGKDLTS